jgi:hypothetical protein
MFAGNVVTAELSDATGSFASPVVLGTLSATSSGTITGTIPASTPTGSGYRIRVTSTNYALTASDNGSDIQIYLVNNSIAPTATQNIPESVAGTQISVTENPAGTSREWKYGTSSGGPYSVFAPDETGTTYTPLFVTAGTYYVICESQIGGITVPSSEATIMVWSTVGMDEQSLKPVNIYWSSDDLIIDLNDGSLTDPVISIYDITGRLLLQKSLENGTINNLSLPVLQGIYIYSIAGEQGLISGQLFKK